jgi:GH24 family phage-related lysozyme (muramidase)
MKTIKKLIFIVLFLTISWPLWTHTRKISNDMKLYTQQKERLKYESIYTEIIDYIKWHESFVNHKYHTGVDTDGWTIGYGHLIKKGETFPDTISEVFADSLLKADFEGAKRMVEFYTPILRKPENKYKLLAISHFVFAKGIGNFNKSQLKIYIEHDNEINNMKDLIAEEIVKWSIVTFDGVSKRNKRMVKNRLFELKIYNHNF